MEEIYIASIQGNCLELQRGQDILRKKRIIYILKEIRVRGEENNYTTYRETGKRIDREGLHRTTERVDKQIRRKGGYVYCFFQKMNDRNLSGAAARTGDFKKKKGKK